MGLLDLPQRLRGLLQWPGRGYNKSRNKIAGTRLVLKTREARVVFLLERLVVNVYCWFSDLLLSSFVSFSVLPLSSCKIILLLLPWLSTSLLYFYGWSNKREHTCIGVTSINRISIRTNGKINSYYLCYLELGRIIEPLNIVWCRYLRVVKPNLLTKSKLRQWWYVCSDCWWWSQSRTYYSVVACLVAPS